MTDTQIGCVVNDACTPCRISAISFGDRKIRTTFWYGGECIGGFEFDRGISKAELAKQTKQFIEQQLKPTLDPTAA